MTSAVEHRTRAGPHRGPAPDRRRRRRVAAATALLGTLAALITLLLPALPARAHAGLVSTDPAEGAVLDRGPGQVVLVFDETVRPASDGARLTGPDGVSQVVPAVAEDARVRISLPPLAEGTQLLSWRVVSADGHPVTGVLSFSVGAPSTPPSPPVAAGSGDGPAGTLLVLARALMTGAVLLVTGLILFERLVLDGGVPLPGARRSARVGALVGSLSAVAVVPLAWLTQQGLPPSALGRSRTTEQLLAEPEALAAALTVLGLLTLAALRGSRPSPWTSLVTGLGGLLAVGSLALTGHTRTQQPGWLVVGADLVHVLAGSVWVGGVLGLVLLLGTGAGAPLQPAARALARFSTLAAVSVVLLAATGTTMAVLVLDDVADLGASGYGRALLLKLGLVAVVLVLAGWNRRVLLPRVLGSRERPGPTADSATDSDAGAWTVLRRTLRHETALLLSVVAVTGLLVSASPDAGHRHTDGAAVAGPHSATADLAGAGTAEVGLDPATTGQTSLTLRLRTADGGALVPASDPVVRLTQPEAGVGPLEVVPTATGEPGVYRAAISLPVAGEWQVSVAVRVSEFSEPVVQLSLPVR